jgi:hypothetical protein
VPGNAAAVGGPTGGASCSSEGSAMSAPVGAAMVLLPSSTSRSGLDRASSCCDRELCDRS